GYHPFAIGPTRPELDPFLRASQRTGSGTARGDQLLARLRGLGRLNPAHPDEFLAGEVAPEVLLDALAWVLGSAASGVRGDDHVRCLPERARRGEWLLPEDVERGAGDGAACQGSEEIGVIDH